MNSSSATWGIGSSTGFPDPDVMLPGAEKRQESVRPHDRVVRTTCTLCPAGCGMKIMLLDGRIVDIWGDEAHPLNKGSLCALGSAAGQLVQSPGRILHPRLRERRDGACRETSWEEALDLVAGKIRTLTRQRGPGSVVIGQGGRVGFGSLLSARRLARLAGLAYADREESDPARLLSLYAAAPPPPEWVKARVIILVGADPASTEVVTMGWIVDARLRGTAVVVLDSRPTQTGAKATRVLPIRPGAWGVLLVALANAVLDTNRDDAEFLREAVVDADSWLAACGVVTPEAAAAATGVGASTIREVAAILRDAFPALVIVDHRPLGAGAERTARAALGLLSLLGSLGVPGGGLVCLGGPAPPVCSGAELQAEPTRGDSRPAALIWEPGDPVSVADGQWGAVLAQGMEFVVALTAFSDPRSCSADVVLPTGLWLEYPGVVHRGTARAFQWHSEIAPPPGEARPGAWIWAALADWLEVGQRFPWRRADGTIDYGTMSDFFLSQEPSTAGLSRALLDPEMNPPGGVLWPVDRGSPIGLEPGATIRGAWRPWDRGRGWPRQGERPIEIGLTPEDARAMLARASVTADTSLPSVVSVDRDFGGYRPTADAWPWIAGLLG